ncbi:MAG: 50S ribosomal protein L25/general stress protein Ctc [Gammaproteobacteria bacterium]|nr:50S ribosomal protein L25/general stress protein Ctc [Gammaproteobacteria bacterium]MDE2345955.1 50S ribosomal protein L25/general stress protein Ctc [Gammaproteobacteria bacterium]
MAISFNLSAEARNDKGKGASRRLRRSGKVPGILYGAGEPPVELAFDHNELRNNLSYEAFYSHVLKIKVGDQEHQAIVKDLQRHPAKPVIMHLDLLRVKDDVEIRVHVPLHFLGEKDAVGVKQQGGVVSRNLIEVEIACLPRYLPEYIDVDVVNLELNHSLHLSDLKLPEGVRIVQLAYGEEHDLPVVAIHHPRITVEEEPVAEAAAAAEGAAAVPAEGAAPAPAGEGKPAADAKAPAGKGAAPAAAAGKGAPAASGKGAPAAAPAGKPAAGADKGKDKK